MVFRDSTETSRMEGNIWKQSKPCHPEITSTSNTVAMDLVAYGAGNIDSYRGIHHGSLEHHYHQDVSYNSSSVYAFHWIVDKLLLQVG